MSETILALPLCCGVKVPDSGFCRALGAEQRVPGAGCSTWHRWPVPVDYGKKSKLGFTVYPTLEKKTQIDASVSFHSVVFLHIPDRFPRFIAHDILSGCISVFFLWHHI